MEFYTYTVHSDIQIYLLNVLLPISYLLVATILKNLLSQIKITITKRLMFLIIATIHATSSVYYPEYILRPKLKAHVFKIFLIPIIFVRNIYIIDFYYVKKYLKEIILITVTNMAIFSIVNSCMLFNFEENRNDWYFMLIFTCCISGIDKVENVRYYKQFEGMRVGISILEGEFVLGACITFSMLTVVLSDTSSLISIAKVCSKYIFSSVIVGLLLGHAVAFLIINRSMNVNNIVCGVTFLVHFISFIFVTKLDASGAIAITIIALILTYKRARFHNENDMLMEKSFEMISYFVEYTAYMIIMLDNIEYVRASLTHIFMFKHISVIFMGELSRVLLLIVLYPIMNRTGKLKIQDFLVLFWFGKRGLFQMVMILLVFVYYDEQKKNWLTVVLYYMAFHHVLLNMFSSVLLRIFKLNVHPEEKITNFINCAKLIENKKKIFMFRLKMNRYLGDCKWELIDKFTEIITHDELYTETKHDKTVLINRKSICRDCNKEIVYVPSKKEQYQMIIEAKQIAITAHKMSVVQQYETCLITRDVQRRMLQNLGNSTENPDLEVEINDFVSMCVKRKLANKIRDTFIRLHQNEDLRPPRKYGRRIVYKMTMCGFYELLLVLFVAATFALFYVDATTYIKYEIYLCNSLAIIVFVTDFVLKLYAYSYIYYLDGFKKYFSYDWHKLEIITLPCNLAALCMAIYMATINDDPDLMVFCKRIFIQITVLRIFRLAAVLHQFRVYIIMISNKILGRRLYLAYSIGLSLMVCYKEVMHMLPILIPNKTICQMLRVDMEKKIQKIYKELFWVQNVMPYIAVDVKTRNLSRVTLCHLKDYIFRLKSSGLIDENVSMYLKEILTNNTKAVLSMRNLSLNSPTGIFFEQSWMDENKKQQLFEHSSVVTWKSGENVMNKGMVSTGIYVVIEGYLTQTYSPNDSILQRAKRYGMLPVVEYLTSTRFYKSSLRYILPGHAIGLLSVLTGRPYESCIISQINSSAYFIPKSVIMDMIEKEPTDLNPFYNNIWKYISMELAANILWSKPQYSMCTDESLYFHMRKAYVPYLQEEEYYLKTEVVDDIILIEGTVEEFYQEQIYIGPCCLPRTINKLKLIKTATLPVLMVMSLKEQIIEYNVKSRPIEAFSSKNFIFR